MVALEQLLVVTVPVVVVGLVLLALMALAVLVVLVVLEQPITLQVAALLAQVAVEHMVPVLEVPVVAVVEETDQQQQA